MWRHPAGCARLPVAGVAADEIIDGTPAIEEIVRRYVGDPRYSNLPRKFKTAISGSPHQDVAHEINDVSFVGVVHPEFGPGFDVFVGGGLSTNPMFAKRLGTWVSIDDVPNVWKASSASSATMAGRRLRTRARIKFLVADWGTEKFRQVLEDDYLHRKLIDGPAPEPAAEGRRDHVGVFPSAMETSTSVPRPQLVGLAEPPSMPSPTSSSARAAIESGSPPTRSSSSSMPADKVDATVADLEALGLKVNPSEFRRGTMACTGIEYCKLAIVETKGRATELIAELEDRLPI